MNNKISIYAVLFTATVMLSALAVAEENNEAAPETQIASVDSAAASSVITGGVGEEMDYLRSIQNQYSLKLLIAEKNGIFLSDVAVHVEDSKGNTVIDTVTTGPVLLAKLPPGTYKAVMKLDDYTMEKKFVVKPRILNAYLVSFPAEDERVTGDIRNTPLK
jgi:hypothetical protein